jgi:hypothetical protein
LSSTTSDTGAGQAVNPKLDKLVTHPQKQFHSFRSTFIIKVGGTGVDNDMKRQITGHSGGDIHADVYGGSAVEDRFEWIKKIDLKWLK